MTKLKSPFKLRKETASVSRNTELAALDADDPTRCNVCQGSMEKVFGYKDTPMRFCDKCRVAVPFIEV